jgi:hypothetical protein
LWRKERRKIRRNQTAYFRRRNARAKPTKLSDDAVAARSPPPDPVTLKTFAGTNDGLVFLATFTFENKGPTDVKDIEVTCTHYGPSGTAIDANTRTIYQIVKAKSSKTVRGFNIGLVHSQASSSSCKIVHYAAG